MKPETPQTDNVLEFCGHWVRANNPSYPLSMSWTDDKVLVMLAEFEQQRPKIAIKKAWFCKFF